VSVSSDGRNLLSRAQDDTLKIWDLRKFKDPLATFTGLENFYDTTNALFSPHDTLFMTGTSVRKDKKGPEQGQGMIHVYDRATLKPVRQLGLPSGSVLSLLWHPKINQMFVGTSSGLVHALYDPRQSENGIMRSVGRAPKKADITSVGINTVCMCVCVCVCVDFSV
jgi:WD40 repeat protein